MDIKKFEEYGRLNATTELTGNRMGIVGQTEAGEALAFIRKYKGASSFELKTVNIGLKEAIKCLDNFKVTVAERLEAEEKKKAELLKINISAAKKAERHFEKNIKPTFEVLIEECKTLATMKGWNFTQSPTLLKDMMNGLEKNIKLNLNDPSLLDRK